MADSRSNHHHHSQFDGIHKEDHSHKALPGHREIRRRAFPDGVIQEVLDEMKGRAETALTPIEKTLAEREFLLGDAFSAADINVAYG